MDKPIFLPLPPQGKPRMTRGDSWNPRKAVSDYWDWKHRLLDLWHPLEIPPPDTAHLVFLFKLPKSYSKKKKASLLWQPHEQKPDTDNCLKAFFDALFDDDKMVWDIRGTKLWSTQSGILIKPLETFELETEIKDKLCELAS